MKNKLKLILVLGLEVSIPFLLLGLLTAYSGNWSLELTQLNPIIEELCQERSSTYIKYLPLAPFSLLLIILNIPFTSSYKQKIKHFLEIIPNKFNQFVKSGLLNTVPNKENTYSLFSGFDKIEIKDVSDSLKFNNLSLNGLVGTSNQEDAALAVTDKQIEDFLDSIRNKVQSIDCGKGHLLFNDNERKAYLDVFDIDKVRSSINEVEEKILEKENTFKFIADQFGIYDIKKTKRCLKIEVYKTTYFTFRVMNNLYSKEKILEKMAERFCKNIENKTICKEGFQALFPFFASLGVNIILELMSKEKGEGFLIQKRNSNAFGNVSQYHISVNETFSFTDIDKMGNPLIEACVLRGIEEEIGVNLSGENTSKRIMYLDVFFNPQRGMIGLSLAYNTDVNPSFISYYPGVDKIIEATKHIYVYDIHDYKRMIFFLSLFNWIIYTPYLLKRYIIYRQALRGTFSTAYKLHKGIYLSIILYYVSCISVISILLFFYWSYHSIIAGLLFAPIINLIYLDLSKKCNVQIKKRKKKGTNIDMASPGEYPFNRNVILYTGMDENRNLEANKIVLALKDSVSISNDDLSLILKKEYNYDFTDYMRTQSDINHAQRVNICWDTINILEHEAGVRHVFKNEEYPTLILKGHITSYIKNKTNLYVREYAIDSESGLFRIGYNIISKDEIKFGFDYEFKTVFKIENQCHLSTYATNLLKKKGYLQLKELKISSQMNGINLLDVYKSCNENSVSIIITAKRQKASEGVFSKALEAKADKLSEELCNLISQYKNTDKQDVLMLQQILIRKGIYLFKKK